LKDWLPQAFRRNGRTLKVLQGLGFTTLQLEVIVGREDVSGASKVNTISLDDFNQISIRKNY